MKIGQGILAAVVLTAASAFFAGRSEAQAPKAATPAKAAPKAVAKGPAIPQANLGQLMKGILYINSNVIFAAQGNDPAKIAQAKDPSVSTDALASTYGKWEAVENSSLALIESANLLSVPGRKCANGRAVPVTNPDWAKFVQGVREAGMVSYNAAKAKDQDKILDAADAITTACSNCHDKYREKPTLAERCM
jgi:cytochrome c553